MTDCKFQNFRQVRKTVLITFGHLRTSLCKQSIASNGMKFLNINDIGFLTVLEKYMATFVLIIVKSCYLHMIRKKLDLILEPSKLTCSAGSADKAESVKSTKKLLLFHMSQEKSISDSKLFLCQINVLFHGGYRKNFQRFCTVHHGRLQ